jgi:hypothetical protein
LPVFRFDKAFGVARNVKAYLSGVGHHKEQAEYREKIRSKKQELSRIKSGIRTAEDPAESTDLRRQKKSKKQEIFLLRENLRAAGERAKGIPDGRVTSEEGPGALPDFVVIGAKKSGTTTLYHLLTQHPHVQPAAAKELNFFGSHYDEGIEWYRRCFPTPRWKDGRRTITGEANPGYLVNPLAPERMAETVPQARLIALLRNPVDRAYSDYHQTARKGREPRTFDEIVEEAIRTGERGEEHAGPADTLYPAYVARSLYADQLLRWSGFFEDEQMLVLKSEDFFERPSQNLERILAFLDLPSWEPEVYEVRKQGRYEQGMDPETRRHLEEFFEPHNRRLYEHLGVDFGW